MGWGPWWLGLTKDFLFWCGLSCFSSVSLSITPVALHLPSAFSASLYLSIISAKYLLLRQEKPTSKLRGHWLSLR